MPHLPLVRRLAAAVTAIGTLTTFLSAPASVAAPAPVAAVASPGPLSAALPSITPSPQHITATRTEVPVSGAISLVVGRATDTAARLQVTEVLKAAGASVTVVTAPAQPRPETPAVYLGTTSDNSEIAGVLGSLGQKGPAGLAAEGYVLVTGVAGRRPVAVLAGVDAAGTYYAAQTLAQIITGSRWSHRIAGVAIRDFPTMKVRGTIEGFYGPPWTHQARLDQFTFEGQMKLNTYIYSPKDDPYLRAQWRDPYPAAKLADLADLVRGASAHHVKFVYALSPGLDLCFSSDSDLTQMFAKFQSLWDVGVRDFNIPFDDIDYSAKHCAGDSVFGTGPTGAGAAQASFLNKVNTQFIQTHPGAGPLQMVPTEYWGVTPSDYKTALRTRMDPSILVQWTGQQVVSTSIHTADAVAAQKVFGHSIFLWDNYPVNDFDSSRLFLGPLIGRDLDLGTAVIGTTSNPMVQSYASMVPLVNFADYSWNTPSYRPDISLEAAVTFLAGPDPQVRSALRAFVDLNWSWAGDTTSAPLLSADIQRFWTAWQSKTPAAGVELSRRLQLIKAATTELAKMARTGFFADAKPWIDAAAKNADAMSAALKMLTALRDNDGADAVLYRWQLLSARTAAQASTVKTLNGTVVPHVGDGQFDTFLTRALSLFDAWLGASAQGRAPIVITDMGQYQNYAPSNMLDGDPATLYWTGQTPSPGQYIGVDLGSVQAISKILVRESAADSDTTGDYFHDGVLQTSSDGVSWTAATPATTAVVSVTPATPIQARYVRILAGVEATWVKVREFAITVAGGPQATPAGSVGHEAARAFDSSVDTYYQAVGRPAAGDSLSQIFTAPRAVALIDVVGSGHGTVQVLKGTTWQAIGALSRGSFNEFPVPSGLIQGVRILWVKGTTAPKISEVIARSVDTAPLTGQLTGPVPTGTSHQSLTLTNAGPVPVTGSIRFDAPAGLRLRAGAGKVTVGRGDVISLPVTVHGTTAGRYTVHVSITSTSGRSVSTAMDVQIVDPVSATNVALASNGGAASASSQYDDNWAAGKGNDGDLSTRWDSLEDGNRDAEWFQIKFAEPQTIGKVVINWEAAYADQYKIQSSTDGITWTDQATIANGLGGTETTWIHAAGIRYLRMQGIKRHLNYGYSLYEMQAYPVLTH